MTPELYRQCERALHVITIEGRVLRAGRAVLFVFERCGLPFTARVLRLPPLVWMVELGYWIVAQNRRLFARFFFRKE